MTARTAPSDDPEMAEALSRVSEAQSLLRVRRIDLGEALTRQREGDPFHFYPEALERFQDANEAHYEALAVVDEIMERRAEQSNRRAAA